MGARRVFGRLSMWLACSEGVKCRRGISAAAAAVELRIVVAVGVDYWAKGRRELNGRMS